MQKTGRFVFITGPMFSGKTEELLNIYKRYILAGKSVLLFKPAIDNRFVAECVNTHCGVSEAAVPICDLAQVFPYLFSYDTEISAVLIDEVQFISLDVADVFTITEQNGIDLIVCGLSLDAFRVPFETSAKILPYAEVIQKKSVCMGCGSFDAVYTKRLTGETDKIVVGGSEKYTVLCRECYLKPSED